MDPLTIGLGAASLGGTLLQIFGGKKVMSPEELERRLKAYFGPAAVNAETVEMFRHWMSSPVGQQMLTEAQQQGNRFASDVAQKSAAAGFGPEGSSGASIFSEGAAQGAGQYLRGQVKSNAYSALAPLAAAMVRDRMQAYLQQHAAKEGELSPAQKIGAVLGQAGSLGLQAFGARGPADPAAAAVREGEQIIADRPKVAPAPSPLLPATPVRPVARLPLPLNNGVDPSVSQLLSAGANQNLVSSPSRWLLAGRGRRGSFRTG